MGDLSFQSDASRSQNHDFSVRGIRAALSGKTDAFIGTSEILIWNAIRAMPPCDQMKGYAALAQVSLARALMASQRNTALRWIAGSTDEYQRDLLMSRAETQFVAALSTSNIAPSRNGPSRMVLERTEQGLFVSGIANWVSGVHIAEYVALGVANIAGEQTMVLISLSAPGVRILRGPDSELARDSDTAGLELKNVCVHPSQLLVPWGQEIITSHKGHLVRGYPSLYSSAICLGHAVATCALLAELPSLPSSILEAHGVLIKELRELEVSIDQLARITPPTAMAPFEETRGRANVAALRAADLFSVALRGRALISGSMGEQRLLESRFFLTWAMSPGAQAQTIERFLHR